LRPAKPRAVLKEEQRKRQRQDGERRQHIAGYQIEGVVIDELDLGRPWTDERAGFASQRRFEALHDAYGRQFLQSRVQDDPAQQEENAARRGGNREAGASIGLERYSLLDLCGRGHRHGSV
jgi:hypothetical protein